MEEGAQTMEFPLAYCSAQQQEAAGVDQASNGGCFFMQRPPFVVKFSLGPGLSPEGAGNGGYGEQGTSEALVLPSGSPFSLLSPPVSPLILV